jgi:hypothetical protein
MPSKAKDAVLAVLVLMNVLLLCVVLSAVVQPSRAIAQVPAAPVASGSQRFLAVSGQIQSGFDAMYMIDSVQQRLYVWTPNRMTGGAGMVLRDMRDLRQDFAKQPAPAVPRRR